MNVKEIRSNGVDYHIHVHRNKDGEILDELSIKCILEELDITADITVTGWEGIHLVIMTSSSPSIKKVKELCKGIDGIETLAL